MKFALPEVPGEFRDRLFRIHTPLRLIFWGGLLLVLDFTVSTQQGNEGFHFDFLNDFAGALLVLIGVLRVIRQRLDRRWQGALVAVAGVAFVTCGWTLLNHAIFPRPRLLAALESLSALAELASILVFCAAMRSFCRSARETALAASWNRTFLLFLVLYAVPLGAFHAAVLLGIEFNLNLGWEAILLLPLFVWPIVHFFMSTSRMIRALETPSPAQEAA
jgi:hypothetical protein